MNTFVIQEHTAKKAGHHYDLRLENGGVYESWAVRHWPSGTEQRLAIKVDDHPLQYGTFEGEIKEGYGKGTVEIFDEGTYTPYVWIKGLIRVRLNGAQLHEEYTLRHWKNKHWLLRRS